MSAGGPSKGKSSEQHIAEQRCAKKAAYNSRHAGTKRDSTARTICKELNRYRLYSRVMSAVHKPRTTESYVAAVVRAHAEHSKAIQDNDDNNTAIGIAVQRRIWKLQQKGMATSTAALAEASSFKLDDSLAIDMSAGNPSADLN